MITNMNDFVSYIRLMLGSPVVNIEVADEQIVQLVEDCTDIFLRYTYGDATYKDAITINISAGVSAYQLPSYVSNVLEINGNNSDADINRLFSVQHEVLYNQFYNGGVVGNGGGMEANMGGAYSIGSFNMSMMYLADISNTFMKQYTCQYSNNTNTLRIYPTPEISHPSMLIIWRTENPTDLYNNILLKKLATAKVKILWGEILGKFGQIGLPGGGTISGQVQMDRGEKEYDAALQSIILETTPPSFMVG